MCVCVCVCVCVLDSVGLPDKAERHIMYVCVVYVFFGIDFSVPFL